MAELSRTSLRSDANLQAYFKLSDVTDELGGTSLTNTGSTAFIAAQFGDGATFTSSNAGKQLSVGDAYGITNTVSISIWWKSLNAPTVADEQSIFELQQAANDVTYSLWHEDDSGEKLSFGRDRFNVARDETRGSVTMGTDDFHHIVMVYASGSMTGYYDGSVIAGPTAMSGNGTNGASDTFIMGLNAGGSRYADGVIDDVGIFDKALSAAEVTSLYEAGRGAAAIFPALL
jgi:hypothetical protein